MIFNAKTSFKFTKKLVKLDSINNNSFTNNMNVTQKRFNIYNRKKQKT